MSRSVSRHLAFFVMLIGTFLALDAAQPSLLGQSLGHKGSPPGHSKGQPSPSPSTDPTATPTPTPSPTPTAKPSPTPTSTPTPGSGGSGFMSSVDTMKESKDAEASGLTNAQISDDVNLSAGLNVRYVTVDTHMEYPNVMGQWVAAIRATGKSVWFRLGTDTCSMSRSTYLVDMTNLILTHPGYFRAGDVFDGDAEAENSCYWINNCSGSVYNCPGQLNAFFQNLTTTADQAFATIGVSGVLTWIHSTDPGTATDGLLTAQTVSLDHNTVTVDAYPDQDTTDPATAAGKWLDQLNEIHNKWPTSSVVIGEAGYSLNFQVSDSVQAAVLGAEFSAIERAAYPWLRGWNYWVGAGGPGHGGYTNILSGSTGAWALRAAATTVAAFYRYEAGG